MDGWGDDDVWGEEPDWAKEDDINETGGEESSTTLVGSQHVVFLIDCHEDMFVPTADDGPRPMALALELAKQLLKNLVRDSVTLKIGKRNGVGLLLYHTKKRRDETSDDEMEDDSDDEDMQKTVHVLLPLVPPGINEVQTVLSCLDEEGDRDIHKEFGSSEEEPSRTAPLQDALEEAGRLFRKAKCVRERNLNKPDEPVDTRSIWILTNRPNPYPTLARLIQNVSQDVKEQGIQIVLWPLPSSDPSNETFDMDAFYGDVVSYQPFAHPLASVEALEDGLDDLQQQWKKIRRLYWGPLILPGSSEQKEDDEETKHIMIDWFRFIQQAKKPAKVQIDQQTKRETIKLKQLVDNRGDIFASFKPGDAEDRKKPKPGLSRLRQYTVFGGEQVPITEDDMKELRYRSNKQRDNPGLTVLGFKNRDSIPFHHTMDPAYLIYPNDDVVRGSREAFIHLHSAMLRKKVVAIGEALHRTHWSSRMVAIFPLEEVLAEQDDDDDEPPMQKRPPGMMVLTLPFVDDIRTLDEDVATANEESSGIKAEPVNVHSLDLGLSSSPTLVSEELLNAATELISRQRLEGMELGDDFENAALTEFYNYLESVALELPLADEADQFDTRLDEEAILEAIGEQIENFQKCLPEDLEKPKGGAARKRKKETVQDDSGVQWEELYKAGDLGSCKVPDLKKYLRSVGAPLSGNKSALLLRVEQHIGESLKVSGGADVKAET